MKESAIQRKITIELEKRGWMVIKLIKTTKNGIPDLIALKEGVTVFVEVKADKGVVSELQKYRHEELRSKGFKVFAWTKFEEFEI